MPFKNEHSGRILEPDFNFWSRDNDKAGKGVHFVYGSMTGKKGSWKIQAIRFDKDKFTAAQAKSWLKEHGQKYIIFESAASGY